MPSDSQHVEPFVLEDGAGTHIWFTNTLMTIKATAKETAGRFSLIEQYAPAGYETPYHVHHEDGHELFYLLEGTVAFYHGEECVRGTPGTSVYLPTEIPHGYRVEDEEPARMLIQISQPELAAFFIEGGESAKESTLPEEKELDRKRLAELSKKYGMEILGPLPEELGE